MSSPGGSQGGRGGGWPSLLSCSPPQPACCLMNPPLVTLTYHSHDCSTATSVSLRADLSQLCHFLTTSLPLLCQGVTCLLPPPSLATSLSGFAASSPMLLQKAALNPMPCSCTAHGIPYPRFMLSFAVGAAEHRAVYQCCLPMLLLCCAPTILCQGPIMQPPLGSMAKSSCIGSHFAHCGST